MNRWNRGSNAWFMSSHHRWPLQRNMNYIRSRFALAFQRDPRLERFVEIRQATWKFARKRRRIYFTYVALSIFIQTLGNSPLLRRNLARWKLFVFGLMYMKRMEMTIQKMETNIENDPTSCNRKRTYPPTNRRERERISIVTKANVKHRLEEMIRM